MNVLALSPSLALYSIPMSLYRTYRPKAFTDVVGQDAVVSTLEQAVAQQKVTHAYLFAGSRGTGKTSVARIMAKALLTRGIEDEAVRAGIASAVDDGSLVDLVEIDGASNRGIDDIRNLVEKIQFSPVVASAKVYIIDEVHMLTKEAFNALLKTLEEPPPYAYFILATTELQKIPATIQSRCQRFLFRHVSEEDIVRRLQYIADQERIVVDRAALRAIAHHADGSVRDAISLLDQLRSLPKIGLPDVEERIGESGHEYVEHIFAAVDAGNAAEILALVAKMEGAGVSLESVARLLLGEARRRLHVVVEAKGPIHEAARELSLLLAALRDMRIAPVPGLVLESALLHLAAGPEEEPAERTSRLFSRKKPAEGKTPAATLTPSPSPAAAPPAAPAEKVEAIIEAPEVNLRSIRDAWPQIVDAIAPPSLKMSLKNGHVHAVADEKITVAFASSFHREKVAKTDAARAVEQVLERLFRRSLRISCVLEEEHTTVGADADMVNVAEAAAEVF